MLIGLFVISILTTISADDIVDISTGDISMDDRRLLYGTGLSTFNRRCLLYFVIAL